MKYYTHFQKKVILTNLENQNANIQRKNRRD